MTLCKILLSLSPSLLGLYLCSLNSKKETEWKFAEIRADTLKVTHNGNSYEQGCSK
ncbi:hypothetical protein PLAN_100161 [Planktothrix rubescens CCAP 1459/22]|uniref:Uncharacterized protein n=1 Tax=Planktothrix rubescens CCAP 1459/22 TaxID=329571 RepID=A0A6J7ZFN7_PLARU|nr:hypothetical protein PLAN_100161 [Planktothrix rubescens NIVA-CYA 18]